MRTIGIIAEYDPFHSGHRHQIQSARRAFGLDCAVVCVMSGNWVQRGQAALADKWTRAKLALEGGIDLVLELPTLWAVSSAETFARGGVSLLLAAGCVDVLSFGSEAGTLEPLRRAAACLQTQAWREHLREGLDRGFSFPVARQQAAEVLLGEGADCLRHPNNNLGIEYLRALRDLGGALLPHTVPRQGAGHDALVPGTDHASASYLRKQILSEDPAALTPYLTREAEALLRKDPASLAFCERAVLARLRSMEDFSGLPDAGEGLDRRLAAAVRAGRSLEEIYALTRSKRYPHARIRRMVLWAFLGLQVSDRPPLPPYLRVLGFSPAGQTLLRRMKESAALPVIVKPAHARRLEPEARRVFQLEERCTRLYDLCRRNFGQGEGLDEYRQNPVRL